MNLFVYFGLAGIVTMFILLINNLRILGWNYVNGYFSIDQPSFDALFQSSMDICYVLIAIYIAELIFAFANMKIFLVVTAAAALGMAIGTWFYLAQGEFLFPFLPGSPQYIFWIAGSDVAIHIVWIVIVFCVSSLIILYALFAIRQTTEHKEKVILKEVESIQPTLITREQLEQIPEIKTEQN